MHLPVIIRVTGVLLTLFSLTLLSPVLVAVIYDESTVPTFAVAFVITLVTGLLMWRLPRSDQELRAGDGFLVTVLFYLGLGLVGALPLYLFDPLESSFTNAAFESLSGLTTTGATVYSGLDDLPRSILFYRNLLNWLGGMGIIVLAVAILPMLGVGGMQLYRAESPGPVKDSKLTPRITETAKALWYLYVGLTGACALSYWVAGMGAFDAICHSFSTVAIGGFSTHDLSIGFFDSVAIESVAIAFMLLSAINFGLHFVVVSRRNPLLYLRDPEVRALAFMLTVVGVIVVTVLSREGDSPAPLREALFQVVSISTTTGFTTANFSGWPSAVPMLLILAAFAGGCAGSTAGGIKMVRVLLLYLQGQRELRRLIHPTGIFPIKLAGQRVPNRVIETVWSFFAAYVFLFLTLMTGLFLITEVDFQTAFSAVGACMNNLGPGLGAVAENYAALPAGAKWLLIFAMLLGRLEIFTLLVLLTPEFWRR
ncbi:MAG: TrkH family potassium uptake protein [Pseudomonadota bacterium]